MLVRRLGSVGLVDVFASVSLTLIPAFCLAVPSLSTDAPMSRVWPDALPSARLTLVVEVRPAVSPSAAAVSVDDEEPFSTCLPPGFTVVVSVAAESWSLRPLSTTPTVWLRVLLVVAARAAPSWGGA